MRIGGIEGIVWRDDLGRYLAFIGAVVCNMLPRVHTLENTLHGCVCVCVCVCICASGLFYCEVCGCI